MDKKCSKIGKKWLFEVIFPSWELPSHWIQGKIPSKIGTSGFSRLFFLLGAAHPHPGAALGSWDVPDPTPRSQAHPNPWENTPKSRNTNPWVGSFCQDWHFLGIWLLWDVFPVLLLSVVIKNWIGRRNRWKIPLKSCCHPVGFYRNYSHGCPGRIGTFPGLFPAFSPLFFHIWPSRNNNFLIPVVKKKKKSQNSQPGAGSEWEQGAPSGGFSQFLFFCFCLFFPVEFHKDDGHEWIWN